MSLSFLLTSLIVIVFARHRRALHAGGGADTRIAGQHRRGVRLHARNRPAYLRRDARPRRGAAHSALAFAALKWCGVIYLLVMAWQALRERGALAVDARLDRRSGKRVIVTGF